ncbi:uncharacterized protein LOC131072395 [Cryptomeria japonica]|uniref:uncharacterized protein LOC131072395 n=1 Tax=Cryptomeria japonica TaxID=3369 RepID=UPI0027DA3728|nr:uncharacterized protein LOC131072395 [Cryptomeria japonica]
MIEDEVNIFVNEANAMGGKGTVNDTPQPLQQPFFPGEGLVAIDNRTHEEDEIVLDASLINKHMEATSWVEEAIVRVEKVVEILDEAKSKASPPVEIGLISELVQKTEDAQNFVPEKDGTNESREFDDDDDEDEWGQMDEEDILEIRTIERTEPLCNKDINREAVKFFLALLSKERNINVEYQQNGLNVISDLIIEAQNQALMKPIQFEEVRKAVFSMAGDKAPGGFLMFFYQTLWDIIGKDVWAVVEESWRKANIAKELNCTLLVLIPKADHPTSFNEFRPISLCNTICKVVVKVISNWLKPILNHIISEEQSGFVLGRSIVGGIIIVHEAIHTVRQAKVDRMLIKLDIRKAYDMVD